MKRISHKKGISENTLQKVSRPTMTVGSKMNGGSVVIGLSIPSAKISGISNAALVTYIITRCFNERWDKTLCQLQKDYTNWHLSQDVGYVAADLYQNTTEEISFDCSSTSDNEMFSSIIIPVLKRWGCMSRKFMNDVSKSWWRMTGRQHHTRY